MKEQLLAQANRLHMEAALLSNTLHEYRDDDVEGVRPVIAKITDIRAQWTNVKKSIAYFDKTGQLPPADPEPKANQDPENIAGLAELKVELSKLSTNIWKYQQKIELTPEHKKVERWKEELAKMEALKIELKENIVKLTYAAK